MLKLGFFASHNGSNMQAIIDACKCKKLEVIPAVVISNNSDSGALQRAKNEMMPYYHLCSKNYPDINELDNAMLEVLLKHKAELIVLAGYMKKIGPKVLKHYKNKILNIHPALLPKYGGPGMYGINVHKAIIEAKEKFTGVTVHLVDEIYDHGRIINQVKIPVLKNDTPDSLSKRVLEQEHIFYVETIDKIIKGEIKL